MCMIRFSAGADFLTLRIQGRVIPDSQDVWDANWLRCIVQAAAGDRQTKQDWQLRNEDLIRWLGALERIRSRSGIAVLDTLDNWLDVQVNRNERGQSEVQYEITEDPLDSEAFESHLVLDEISFLAVIRQVREAIERYPLTGAEKPG